VSFLPDTPHPSLPSDDPEVISSVGLTPGIDPVMEADRQGTILAILRMSNQDMAVRENDK
jgi:hypothetical protein